MDHLPVVSLHVIARNRRSPFPDGMLAPTFGFEVVIVGRPLLVAFTSLLPAATHHFGDVITVHTIDGYAVQPRCAGVVICGHAHCLPHSLSLLHEEGTQPFTSFRFPHFSVPFSLGLDEPGLKPLDVCCVVASHLRIYRVWHGRWCRAWLRSGVQGLYPSNHSYPLSLDLHHLDPPPHLPPSYRVPGAPFYPIRYRIPE